MESLSDHLPKSSDYSLTSQLFTISLLWECTTFLTAGSQILPYPERERIHSIWSKSTLTCNTNKLWCCSILEIFKNLLKCIVGQGSWIYMCSHLLTHYQNIHSRSINTTQVSHVSVKKPAAEMAALPESKSVFPGGMQVP